MAEKGFGVLKDQRFDMNGIVKVFSVLFQQAGIFTTSLSFSDPSNNGLFHTFEMPHICVTLPRLCGSIIKR